MTRLRLAPQAGSIDATVFVPGSKSVANRALICAALADGVSTLTGIPPGDDSAVIVDVLREAGRVTLGDGGRCTIAGSPSLTLPGIVDARLAGTSSRFLTAVAALGRSTTVIDGDDPLRDRPMNELHEALARIGATVTPLGKDGHLPVSVSGGALTGKMVNVKGDVSSQFVSALMLIAPLLPEGLSIVVDGPLVSRSYVEMTASVMTAFGASVTVSGGSIEVAAGGYAPTDYHVEPDYSSAAFPLCAIALRPGRVRVPNLASSALQGDASILEILVSMGITVDTDGVDIVVSRDASSPVLAVERDMSDCSDLVPVVAVAALAAEGVTTLSGIGFIRNKESDRIGDLATELTKIGGFVSESSDGLRIGGGTAFVTATIDSHHDHRLVMALALASLRTTELFIDDAEAVSKSWPTFFHDMQSILGVPRDAN